MSAPVGVYAAMAMFLAIGGDTEEVMHKRMRLEAEENCEVSQPIRTRPPCWSSGGGGLRVRMQSYTSRSGCRPVSLIRWADG
jgi:hypothetical protein